MTKTRKLWALLALVLTLILTACSTSEDLAGSPQLKAQFGIAEDDIGVDVASVSTGRIYSLFQQQKETVDEEDYRNITESLMLRRLDNNGKTIWTKNVAEAEYFCSDYSSYCYGEFFEDYSLAADLQGNVTVLA